MEGIASMLRTSEPLIGWLLAEKVCWYRASADRSAAELDELVLSSVRICRPDDV